MPAETLPACLADAVPYTLPNDEAAVMVLELLSGMLPQRVAMRIGATTTQRSAPTLRRPSRPPTPSFV